MDDCDQVADSQGPEPTNRDIMRMLQTINTTLTNKLDSLSDTVERLQGEIFDLQENNKKLTKELEDYRQRETEMKSQAEETSSALNLLSSVAIRMNNILDCGI